MEKNKKAQGKSRFSAFVILSCFIGGYLPSRIFFFYNLSVFVLSLLLVLNVSASHYCQVYYSTKNFMIQALARYTV